jgi:type I restriction enzyme, S subunit
MKNCPPNETGRALLRDITSKIGSGATPRGGERAYTKTGTPLIRSMNVHFDGFHPEGLAHIDDSQAAALNGVIVRTDDVLLNITGASIGRVTLAPKKMEGARVNQHVCIIRPTECLEAGFLARYLASPDVQAYIAEGNYGVTRQALTKGMIENLSVPVPSLEAQRSTITRLDSYFARSAAARQELGRIPALVVRYRQAVLAAAFRDKKGIPWPSKNLEDLIVEGPTNGYSPRSGDNPNGTLSLKLTATTRGVLDLSERSVKRLNEKIGSNSKFWLRSGDLLIQRANSLEYVGTTAIYQGPPETYIYPDLMIRVRAKSRLIARWIYHYCASNEARRYFIANATGTAGNMPKINGKTVKKLLVPIPPSEAVLLATLEKLEAALAKVTELQRQAKCAAALFDRLEQSALAKAFESDVMIAPEVVTAS